MEEKRDQFRCPKSPPESPMTRREFLSTASKVCAGTVLLGTSAVTPDMRT